MHSQLLHHTDLLRSYICSKNVNNYEHFGDPNKGRCALHDNVEDVHEQAVKRAADEAMAKVKAENPELSEADLMVEVSDRVKQAEAARRGRAAERLNEFPYEMLANQLVHRPGFPRIPPLQGAGAEPPRYVDPFPNYLEIFGQDIPHPIGERGEEDRQVFRGPYRGHEEPDPFPPPHLHQHPTFPPPGPEFVYDHETGMFKYLWRPVIFNPWNNTLFDYRRGVLHDLRTDQLFQFRPPIYRNPDQRFIRRDHPNDHY
jgi:hypothetical protein